MLVCGSVLLEGFQGPEQDCCSLNGLKLFPLGVPVETCRRGLKDYFQCIF